MEEVQVGTMHEGEAVHLELQPLALLSSQHQQPTGIHPKLFL